MSLGAPEATENSLNSNKFLALGIKYQLRRDRLISQKGQHVTFKCIFSNRMVTTFVINHPDRSVPDSIRETSANCFRSDGISLVPENQ
jgi:hypothetical protein